MGNTDSHSSFVSPARPLCSLRFSSRREEVPSARSWWRSSQGNCRSRGRSYLSQRAGGPPHASWEYESRAGRGGCRPRSGSGSGSSSRVCVERTCLESGGSPKVLFSRDGSMRVEFTNCSPVKAAGLTGLPAVSATTAPGGEALLRTSKGSSLSSDGSWYDSPWGTGTDQADSVFTCGQGADDSSGYTTFSSTRTEETAPSSSSGGYASFFSAQTQDVSLGFNSNPNLLFPAAETEFTSASSGRTEDSGVWDSVVLQPDLRDFSLMSSSASSLDHVYTAHSMLPGFPAAPDISPQPRTTSSSSSSSAQLDGVSVEQRYSSLTLPGRTAESASTTCGNSRKDFLKSRIQRLSDWTGSLSRKKRRLQEPCGSRPSDAVINPLCSSTHLPDPHQNQLRPLHCGSSRSLSQSSSDAQCQNIYENFVLELETGVSSAAERTKPSEGEEEEEEGEVAVGGVEQLDVLFEKEQGIVRRAGWLSFKALITINKDRKLELVARRRWRRYWVTLKGCSLLFHETYGKNGGAEQELSPRYALLADDSVVQAVPEHPRKEHVFCLSNRYGDVYLFQATNQTDLENWVTSIHSASASLLAKRQGREDTLRLLRCQTRALLHKIDMDGKMKKMAELQLSVIKEQKSRKAVESQIQQWEQNLEKLNLDLFRLRCYLSSLQGSELPNPKSLLAVASRPSKSMLGRLGVFSVSSFHALVCSRGEVTLRRGCPARAGGHGRRRGLPSSLKPLNGQKRRSKGDGRGASQRLDIVSTQREAAPPAGCPADPQVCDKVFSLCMCRLDAAEDFGFAVTGHMDGAAKTHIYVSEVDPLGLSAREGLRTGDEILAVNGATVSRLDLDLMQCLFSHQNLQLLLSRNESPDPEEPATVWLEPADPRQPLAPLQTCTTALSPVAAVEAPDNIQPPAFDDVSARTSERAEPAGQEEDREMLEEEDEQGAMETFGGVGLLDEVTCCLSCQLCADGFTLMNMERLCSLYQTFPEGRAVEANVPKNPYGREAVLQPTSPTHLSAGQRLCKVIQELVDTEKSYVKDLVCLFDIYLTPLQKETFLSRDEMEALFGSLPEMLDFQRVFLQTLEERIAACPNFSSLETPEQFKKLLFSLGGSFLYYADHFKLYSGFCANHIKVQKVLERAKTDGGFKHFLETRNPTNQHSSSLESYLIKPVQRILKYPLLLRELVSLTDPESPEHTHLTEALRAMEEVASHINEMQKISEDYGSVLEQLAAEQSAPDKQVTEISMGEFLVHASLLWLNPLPCLGRLRKEPELTLFVFKRAVVLVYRDSSKVKKRMTGSRSADLDPFRFRWLIPVSAVQVRPANITGSENPCVWELVHSRSEVEGRPETVFQLCSSGLEAKANVLRALRPLLTEQVPAGSLRRTRLSTAERSNSWGTRQRRKATVHQPEGSRSPVVLGDTCSEPLLPSHSSATVVTGRRTRLCSLTSELEAQLQRLNFMEDNTEHVAKAPSDEWRNGVKRHSSSLRRSPGDILELERDFSVQSMTSMINEDCFYDSVLGMQTVAGATLQGWS